ncbi:MAG: type II toxin-antitoxin system RelE/ParE family toxin [Planctomycetia bacterium]
MSLPLEFHPDVQVETDAAYSWYERQRTGLGAEFLDAVERVLAEIAANPSRRGFAEGDVRAGSPARFPYAVYYRVLDDRIRVLAVFHTARDPSAWHSRS